MSVTISGLPPASALTGTELVPVVQSSVTLRTTTQDIADLAGGSDVTSVNGQTGVVVLDAADVGAVATGTTTAVANGGTGQTSANAALNAFLPAQSGHSGEFLTTDGTNASWASAAGGGLKYALGAILADGTVMPWSVNVDSVSHPDFGEYIVDFTSAGFTLDPVVVVTSNVEATNFFATQILSNVGCEFFAYDITGGSVNTPFSFIALGF